MQNSDRHQIQFRVYYEDTDAGGVVYHANYLKFLERARTEWLRSKSLSHKILLNEYGLAFVVGSVDIAFRQPAKLDDEVLITTEIVKHSRVRMTMQQKLFASAYNDSGEDARDDAEGSVIERDWRLCTSAMVQIVVVTTGIDEMDGNNSTKMKPKPLPQKLYDKLLS